MSAGHLFWSANQDVQPNPGNDLYRFDAEAPAGERLTDVAADNDPSHLCPGTGTPCGAQVQGVLGASADGAYLYYVANGAPDGGVSNSPNANGEEAELGSCKGAAGTCNLYLWHEGETSFIGRLAGSDSANWAVQPGFEVEKSSRVTPDGRTLLFSSTRQLTKKYDNEGERQLYRYRVGDPGPTCVSCVPTGAPPSGPARLGSLNNPLQSGANPAALLSRNLSADGNRVFFESTDALVAADTNGEGGCPIVGGQHQKYPACLDVYEWEANGTGSCESEAQNGGCLHLLSTGKSDSPSLFGDADESGEDVFIFTNSQLVAQDKDSLIDIYDVREGGGLASQSEVEPDPCESEGCKPPPLPAPPAGSPASASFAGEGNVAPARKARQRRCPKGKRKARRGNRSRCVAREKRQGRQHQRRAAKTNGRAGR